MESTKLIVMSLLKSTPSTRTRGDVNDLANKYHPDHNAFNPSELRAYLVGYHLLKRMLFLLLVYVLKSKRVSHTPEANPLIAYGYNHDHYMTLNGKRLYSPLHCSGLPVLPLR